MLASRHNSGEGRDPVLEIAHYRPDRGIKPVISRTRFFYSYR